MYLGKSARRSCVHRSLGGPKFETCREYGSRLTRQTLGHRPRARAKNIRSRLGVRVCRLDPGVLRETPHRIGSTTKETRKITSILRTSGQITDVIIAKARGYLRVQAIAIWKAGKTLFNLRKEKDQLENQRCHNEQLYILKPYVWNKNMPNRF